MLLTWHAADGACCWRGRYAGVPEEMLELPLPHVAEEVRVRTLRKLLHDMRKKGIEEVRH